MEMITTALQSFTRIDIWLAIIAGTMTGITIGAVPGLGPAVAMALALPFTYVFPAEVAIPFLLAIYSGSNYGGSISSVLLNIPGTAGSVATAMDGYPLARKGYPNRVLKASLYSSVFGNTVGTLVLILLIGKIAQVTLQLGPAQVFALLCFAFLLTCVLDAKSSRTKGLIAGGLGILLAVAGLDPITGTKRFDFLGLTTYGALEETAVLVGSFAFAEALKIIRDYWSEYKKGGGHMEVIALKKKLPDDNLTVKEWLSHWKLFTVTSCIGAFFGACPGLGGTIAAFTGYGYAKSTSKNPEEFGTGRIEGVIGPESANNGTFGSNMLPFLTLGIPGSPTVALLGAALMMQGISPSPTIFAQHGGTLYLIFGAMILCNPILLLVGLSAFNKIAAKIARVPVHLLVGGMIVLCCAGIYSINNTMYNVYVMVAVGILCFMLRKAKIPVSTMIITFILGRDIESVFRQTLLLGKGEAAFFFSGTASHVIWGFIFVFLIYVFVSNIVKSRQEKAPKSE